jgi:hypothetical protein
MRLREFAADFVKSEAAALMTILNHLHSEKGDGAKVPFSEISSFMNSAGYVFTYKQFQDLLNSVPSIGNLVTAKSEKEIVIGQETETQPGQPKPQDIVGGMASKAASAAINK